LNNAFVVCHVVHQYIFFDNVMLHAVTVSNFTTICECQNTK